MKTDVARDYTDKWNNNLRVTGLTATLTDDTAPALALSGALADGSWHNESRPVPLTVSATDAGAGARGRGAAVGRGQAADDHPAAAEHAERGGEADTARATPGEHV